MQYCKLLVHADNAGGKMRVSVGELEKGLCVCSKSVSVNKGERDLCYSLYRTAIYRPPYIQFIVPSLCFYCYYSITAVSVTVVVVVMVVMVLEENIK